MADYVRILKMNPYHEKGTGKFTTKARAMGFTGQGGDKGGSGGGSEGGARTLDYQQARDAGQGAHRTMEYRSGQEASAQRQNLGKPRSQFAQEKPGGIAGRHLPGLSYGSLAEGLAQFKPTNAAPTRMGEGASTSEQHEAAAEYHQIKMQRWMKHLADPQTGKEASIIQGHHLAARKSHLKAMVNPGHTEFRMAARESSRLAHELELNSTFSKRRKFDTGFSSRRDLTGK